MFLQFERAYETKSQWVQPLIVSEDSRARPTRLKKAYCEIFLSSLRIFNAVSRSSIFKSVRHPAMAGRQLKEWQETYPFRFRIEKSFQLLSALAPHVDVNVPESIEYIFFYRHVVKIENGIFEEANDMIHYSYLIQDKIRFFKSRREERIGLAQSGPEYRVQVFFPRIFYAACCSSFFTSVRHPVMAEGHQQSLLVNEANAPNQEEMKEWQKMYPFTLRFTKSARLLNALVPFVNEHDSNSVHHFILYFYILKIEMGIFATANDRIHYYDLIEDKIRFFGSRRNERRLRRNMYVKAFQDEGQE
ncbi:Hypothetical predicted protein [Cloeon dipterum]|uniref:KIX domain-containing protein n=1 Tax=Cloeon dipterum TaxID=197152 RepID=A0A8S1D335_9INSE|nr:Hypothetical predicted protein [Cloeon dipterum]